MANIIYVYFDTSDHAHKYKCCKTLDTELTIRLIHRFIDVLAKYVLRQSYIIFMYTLQYAPYGYALTCVVLCVAGVGVSALKDLCDTFTHAFNVVSLCQKDNASSRTVNIFLSKCLLPERDWYLNWWKFIISITPSNDYFAYLKLHGIFSGAYMYLEE